MAADPLRAYATSAEQERLRVLALQRAREAAARTGTSSNESTVDPLSGSGGGQESAGASESKSGDAGDALAMDTDAEA